VLSPGKGFAQEVDMPLNRIAPWHRAERPRRLESGLPLIALLIAGGLSLVAFIGLHNAPLPEQAVLLSVEQVVAPAPAL
jgi:hypothetical protein